MNNDNSRKMDGNNFAGATFTGNANFQGDHNNQTYESGLDGPTQELFAKLIEEIKSTIADPEERDDNLADVERIKEAAASGNKARAAKFFSRLAEAIKLSSVASTLAKNLGLLTFLA
ncbi:hypothetical protein GCM10010912_17380 [Paenibacillus albidus]|uniref:Uncharacterized protein n=1 Tax=Paenibacillus albidus TaxID=2041023 RepID=A0A917FFF3_9BACL|nr:hypothetical protein [Paenibacillus albidus]GGF72704.1 hypothetical protein GCM10010912_17380 [Paenibacillus albidus]